jgi:hypothetical protein
MHTQFNVACTVSQTTSADSAILEGWKTMCADLLIYYTSSFNDPQKTYIPYNRDLRVLQIFELLKPYFYNENL